MKTREKHAHGSWKAVAHDQNDALLDIKRLAESADGAAYDYGTLLELIAERARKALTLFE